MTRYRFKVESKDSAKIATMLGIMFPGKSQEANHLKAFESITLIAEKTTKTRTRPQENYYRKWCGEFAKWAGLTPDEMHEEILCLAFGTVESETKFGVKRRPVKRSGQVKREEYSLLIEQLILTAAEIGFAIPPPPMPEQYEEYANG